jgi:hypothetical protein
MSGERNNMRLVILSPLLLLVSGCALMTRGSTQMVSVSSNPAGATVMIDGMYRGVTPVAVSLKRNSDHSGSVSLQGYAPFMFTITRTPTGAILGNIFFGGLIGGLVDVGTGANNDLTPSSIYAPLRSD